MFVKLPQRLSLSVSNAILGISNKLKLRNTLPLFPPLTLTLTIPYICSLLFLPSIHLLSTSSLLTSPQSSFLTPSVANMTNPRRFAYLNGPLSSPISNLILPFTRRFFPSLERGLKEQRRFFYQMELQGISRNAVTYNTLIDGLCQNRRVKEASQLMDQMMMEDLKPDKFTYNSLLTYFCRAGILKWQQILFRLWLQMGVNRTLSRMGSLLGAV